jgi:hypothetical protein
VHTYRFIGLDAAQFEPLFELTDDELSRMGARRSFADESPGFPCRVSLEDAEVGDELLLLPFEHQAAVSPYRASGPIFVRRGARQRTLDAADLPPYVSRRLMSVRAYDATHMMIDAAVCEGRLVGTEIERQLSAESVAYIHLHNAKRGCFSCRVERT